MSQISTFVVAVVLSIGRTRVNIASQRRPSNRRKPGWTSDNQVCQSARCVLWKLLSWEGGEDEDAETWRGNRRMMFALDTLVASTARFHLSLGLYALSSYRPIAMYVWMSFTWDKRFRFIIVVHHIKFANKACADMQFPLRLWHTLESWHCPQIITHNFVVLLLLIIIFVYWKLTNCN